MLCPKCNCKYDASKTDTCPSCRHRQGASMYLDAAVKIDDNSIIVDEALPGQPDRPAATGAAPETPRRQERRRPPAAPVPGVTAAPAGTKSLAITAFLGAVLLLGVAAAGLYYLKYRPSGPPPEGLAQKPLLLPRPHAPAPTYKTASEEKPQAPAAAPTGTALQAGQQAPQAAEPGIPTTPPEPAVAAPPEEEQPASTQRQAGAPTDDRQPGKKQAAPMQQPPVEKAPAPAAAAAPAGRYELLCGSFKSRQAALSIVEKLKRNNYAAFLERADLGQRGVWYRAKISGFSSRNMAEKVRAELKSSLNIDSLAKKRN